LDDPRELTGKELAMRPLRTRLEEARKRLGIPWEVLERDYLLSWVLAGIGQVEQLRETLVFKGGTALKKCYFGDYRFSEDLDFSCLPDAPIGAAMEEAIGRACVVVAEMLDEYAPIEVTFERYTEKEPHPGGQEAFTIRAQFPWHRNPHTRVIVEASVDEQILMPIQQRAVIHKYGEPLDMKISVYALEEIVAEKLRAILQHAEKLEHRGWSRSRARDFYDLWRILHRYRNEMHLDNFRAFLTKKCALRHVSFDGADDFFEPTLLAHVERTWKDWLEPLVAELPTFDQVIKELRPQIVAIV
jgi:predicted nucleotidyltransferase component of viral defense system